MSDMDQKRTSFGVASMVAINKTTGVPYGIIKIIQNAEATMDRESVDLFGGANPNPWEVEYGNVSSEISVTLAEFRPFLYRLAGYDITSTVGTPSNGSVSSVTNLVGTTASGITVALSTSLTDLKRGRYIIKATTGVANTVNVYATTDNDFRNGTALSFVDENLKISTAAIALSTAFAAIPKTSIKAKRSTGSLTANDAGYFDVNTANEGVMKYSYGENPTPIEFELMLVSQKKGNKDYFIDHYPRARFSSVPGSMNAKEWTNASITIKTLYDSTYGYASARLDQVSV